MKKILISLAVGLVAVALTGCVAQSVPRLSLKVNPVTHEVTLSNPKDTTIKNFSAIVTPGGVSSVSFDSLTTVMNPDVITTTGEAQAKLISATGEAVSRAMATVPKP